MIKKTILKFLNLTDLDEFLKRNEKRFSDLENSIDDFEYRINDLEGHEILDYNSDDFVADGDYCYDRDKFCDRLDEIESDHADLLRKCEQLEDDKQTLEYIVAGLTRAVKKLAAQANLESEIENILENPEDED